MIEVNTLNKSFNCVWVLKDITTRFSRGKANLIIGRSGSGKSVLLKSIVGLLEIDSGEILFEGQNFTRMNFAERKKIRRKFGMLFQGGALFDSLTVYENISFNLDFFTSMTKKEKQKRVKYCLELVNLKNVTHLYPSELSGGMKKRTAIARAIVMNPSYLFCDEPNSGLDPETATIIDNLIKRITLELGITTVINTHDINSVLEIGDNVLFIHEGQNWWEGTKEEIFTSGNEELNDFVFATEIIKRIKPPNTSI